MINLNFFELSWNKANSYLIESFLAANLLWISVFICKSVDCYSRIIQYSHNRSFADRLKHTRFKAYNRDRDFGILSLWCYCLKFFFLHITRFNNIITVLKKTIISKLEYFTYNLVVSPHRDTLVFVRMHS